MVEGRYIIKFGVNFILAPIKDMLLKLKFFSSSCNNPLFNCDGLESELKAYGAGTFCLSEFNTRNGGIFMFRVDNVLHYTMKNQSGNQYGVTFVQKTYVFKYLINLNG